MSEWKKTDDLVSKIEELERELEIRGGVLELHRIRIGELECAERQRDELLVAAERQFSADHVLMNMPHDCTKQEHESALDEHTNAHYALRAAIAAARKEQEK